MRISELETELKVTLSKSQRIKGRMERGGKIKDKK